VISAIGHFETLPEAEQHAAWKPSGHVADLQPANTAHGIKTGRTTHMDDEMKKLAALMRERNITYIGYGGSDDTENVTVTYALPRPLLMDPSEAIAYMDSLGFYSAELEGNSLTVQSTFSVE